MGHFGLKKTFDQIACEYYCRGYYYEVKVWVKQLILFRWKTTDYYVTDNGKEFDNKTVREVLEAYGVISDAVQRCNKTENAYFDVCTEDHRDRHIREFHPVINTATQSSEKDSPASRNLGRHPRPATRNRDCLKKIEKM